MDEDVDGRVRRLGCEDVEPLDRGRAIGEALGRAEALAHELAVPGKALEDVVEVGRIDQLIIGVVEVLLVHVEPDQRTLLARRLRSPLRHGGAARGGRRARRRSSKQRSPCEMIATTWLHHALPICRSSFVLKKSMPFSSMTLTRLPDAAQH